MDSDSDNDSNFTQTFSEENIDKNENNENETDSDNFRMGISQRYLDYIYPMLLSAFDDYVRNDYLKRKTVSRQDILYATMRSLDQSMEDRQFSEQIRANAQANLLSEHNMPLPPSSIANLTERFKNILSVNDVEESDLDRSIKRALMKLETMSIASDTASYTIPQSPNYLAPSQLSCMSWSPSASSTISSTPSTLSENNPEHLWTMDPCNVASTSSANTNEHTVSTDMSDMESEANSSSAMESPEHSRYRRSRPRRSTTRRSRGPVNYF